MVCDSKIRTVFQLVASDSGLLSVGFFVQDISTVDAETGSHGAVCWGLLEKKQRLHFNCEKVRRVARHRLSCQGC